MQTILWTGQMLVERFLSGVSVRRLLRFATVPMTCGALSAVFVGGAVNAAPAGEEAPRALTVADAIETARFQVSHESRSVFVSPDKASYVSMVIRGDTKNDGIWLDVLSGDLRSLDAAKPRLVRRFFTHGLPLASPYADEDGGALELINPGTNIPVWLSNDEIALLWIDERGHNQIFELNVRSNQLKQLTHEETGVVVFVVGANRSLAYDVKVPYSPERSQDMIQAGFSVKNPDTDTLLSEVVDGTSLYDLVKCRAGVAVQIKGVYQSKSVADSLIQCDFSRFYWGEKYISPDGRRLVVNTQVSRPPADWSAYRGTFGNYLRDAEQDPHNFGAVTISKFVIVDFASGTGRPLWSAPTGINPSSTIAWSPDSKAVLVAPTMLPVADSDAAALEGDAVAVVDAQTGRYQRVPVDPNIAANIVSTSWVGIDQIALVLHDGGTIDFHNIKGQWRQASQKNASGQKDHSVIGSPRIMVEVRQDANQSPVLMGSDVTTGRSDILFDPNPNLLERFALGRVELIRWSDASGHRWEGRLYYPAHYRAGVRYPLVIQTHGYARQDEFSIYGQGSPWAVPLGPGWSVYLAQPLASRDIAVLQIGGPDDAMSQKGTDFEGTKSTAKALADAAEHLVRVGLVDNTKVGIMGHSATGRVIEDALAFTDFPYAAAIAADNYELSYSQAMETGWDHDEGMPAPFGKDLDVWLNNSPAFNVDQIRTPLQLEVTSGGDGSWPLLRGWEMFSRLRHLKKPVEYYVLPDIRHGSHYVQNPRQLLALQNRALDWWLFWLKDEEDPDKGKVDQYAEWQTLRALHQADLAKPREPRLNWSVSHQ